MYGLTIAFKDYLPFLGYSGSPWVGLKHFQELFTGPDFGRLMINTLVLALLTVRVRLPGADHRGAAAQRGADERLEALGPVADLHPALPVLDDRGVADLPAVLGRLRGDRPAIHAVLGGRPVDYVATEQWFRPIIVLQPLWKQTGWGTIVYLAALAGVDTQLYEAARVDGAGRWRQFWHITLPAIRPAIVVMAILTSGHLLDTGFEQIWLMTTSLNRRSPTSSTRTSTRSASPRARSATPPRSACSRAWSASPDLRLELAGQAPRRARTVTEEGAGNRHHDDERGFRVGHFATRGSRAFDVLNSCCCSGSR